MAVIPSRLLRPLRGVPFRLGLLLCAGALAGGLAMLPDQTASAPAVPLPEGKYLERLVFAGQDDEVPTREGRLYDTLAMFGLPPSEPKPWSVMPVVATAADAGIRPSASTGSTPRMIVIDAVRRGAERGSVRPAARTADARALVAGPASSAGAAASAADPGGVEVFGWEVPGSRHIPTKRDAVRAVEHAGAKASAFGHGAGKAVGRAASALGDGLAGAGSAIASTLGWH